GRLAGRNGLRAVQSLPGKPGAPARHGRVHAGPDRRARSGTLLPPGLGEPAGRARAAERGRGLLSSHGNRRRRRELAGQHEHRRAASERASVPVSPEGDTARATLIGPMSISEGFLLVTQRSIGIVAAPIDVTRRGYAAGARTRAITSRSSGSGVKRLMTR